MKIFGQKICSYIKSIEFIENTCIMSKTKNKRADTAISAQRNKCATIFKPHLIYMLL